MMRKVERKESAFFERKRIGGCVMLWAKRRRNAGRMGRKYRAWNEPTIMAVPKKPMLIQSRRKNVAVLFWKRGAMRVKDVRKRKSRESPRRTVSKVVMP